MPKTLRILVIGGGAREHALCWALARSPQCGQLYCAPGNWGTGQIARNISIAANDLPGLVAAAKDRQIDLTIVGPEEPLALGIVDLFREAGLLIVGATQAGAQIESSKWWAKEIMRETGIATGRGAIFRDSASAIGYLDRVPTPVVIKADGLAAGKGVVVAHEFDEAVEAVYDFMDRGTLGQPAERLIVEEFLEGPEVSLMAFVDGQTVLPLLPACDHKRINDGDLGPNTGGMGAYAPTTLLDAAEVQRIVVRMMVPVIKRMVYKKADFSGILYAGLILTEHGPKVLEFNARFGDPETQVVLPLLQSDLVEVFLALTQRRLKRLTLEWSPGAAVGVVLASGGYPGPYQTGLPIRGLDNIGDGLVFHAGTRAGDDGGPVTAGGRILTVVGRGTDLAAARDQAYAAAAQISFPGHHLRRDIAQRELVTSN